MKQTEKDTVVFSQNPQIDYLFGYYGNSPILTKQDKFKPIEVIGVDESGSEERIKNFYVKKPNSKAVTEFQNSIQELAKGTFNDENKILKPEKIEVFLSITMTEKRFKEVDVDNLAKSVLDCLIDIAFEDDSQVTNLVVTKNVHPMKLDSIFIAITKLTKERKGLISDIFLFREGKLE